MEQVEFYDLYRQYSTADLIHVVREKDNYQAAADWVQPVVKKRVLVLVLG
jgi:hypothetical protein